MNEKDKILKILNNNITHEYEIGAILDTDNFECVAQEIVKLFAISIAARRSYHIKALFDESIIGIKSNFIIYTKIETSPENTSGLTDHELNLEKIVDKIREADTTIEAICVLKDSINDITM